MKRILYSFSHPDDESFSVGGTAAKYAKLGWDQALVVATNGEAGDSGEHTWAVGDALGNLRQEETGRAVKELGISTVKFLGHKDGKLSDVNPGEMEDKLYRVMIDWLPDIVITFDSTGISNHPDHIRTSLSTTYAFQKYARHLFDVAKPDSIGFGRGKEWREHELMRSFADVKVSPEPKLYYACIPSSLAAYMVKMGAHPSEAYGKPWKGTPDEKVTTAINIKEFAPAKKRALKAHETQANDVKNYIAAGADNPFLSAEYFMLRMQGIYEIFMGKTDRMETAL